jgi:hypothetical protein
MFINTLPMRLQLGVSVGELVQQTQREVVELLRYEQTPLSSAQRCSGLSAGVPLFSAVLNYRHSAQQRGAPQSGAESEESGIRVLGGQERTNYPLTVSVDDLGEGFALTAQVDRRIDAQRVMQYLHTAVGSLVEALEEAPQRLALQLQILPARELQQVITEFNATQREYPRVVRGAGTAQSARDCGGVRGSAADLFRAEREGESTGAVSAQCGSGCG